MALVVPIAAGERKRKDFFFEKKKQKTFATWGGGTARANATGAK